MRESPSLKLIEMIEKRGGMVDYYDPFIPIVPVTREHAELAGRRSIMWDATRISGYDAVLIATDHDGVDYAGLARHAKIVVDTRNACARHGVSGANIVKA
jgi:UDP-N-acetyl-D-glucosamine dehydrogenase